MRFISIFLFLVIALSAHNLKIFTSKDKDSLHVKAYFSVKSPCIECNVSVKRYDGETFTCTTDKNGEATIPLDINPIKVTVNAGLGHKNSLKIIPNLKNESTTSSTPFYLKLILALFCIIAFFAGMKWTKR